MVVSDVSEALALATWPVRLAPGTPEWLGPLVMTATMSGEAPDWLIPMTSASDRSGATP